MRLKLLVLTTFVSAFVLSQSCFADDIVWTKYTHYITRLQFNNDDSKILTVGEGGIIIFNSSDGSQVKQLPGKGVYSDGYSDDGSLIYISHLNSTEHYIDIFDSQTYDSLKRIELPEIVGNYGINLSPDNKTIAVSGKEDMYFVDYETGTIKKHLTKFGDETRKISLGNEFPFTKDGKYIVITLADPVKGEYGRLMFINTETYNADYSNDYGWKGGISLNNDGSLIAYGTSEEGQAVTVMNTQTHEIVGQIPGNAGWVTSMVFSPDGQYLAVSDLEYNTKIYSTNNWSLIRNYTPGRAFSSIDISSNNKYLLGGIGQIIQLFNFQTTGITDENEAVQTIFPNPTSNLITLSFNLPVCANLSFNLYDMTGVLVEALKTGTYETGTVEENLYLNNIANGTYYLKIESSQFNKTFKILIEK